MPVTNYVVICACVHACRFASCFRRDANARRAGGARHAAGSERPVTGDFHVATVAAQPARRRSPHEGRGFPVGTKPKTLKSALIGDEYG